MANRFFITSTQIDAQTISLRGIYGTFKPENSSEYESVQIALKQGASLRLKQAEPAGNGLWSIYFDRSFIGSVCQKANGYTAYSTDETPLGIYETLETAASVL